jgi:hypothetical protein
MRTSRCYDAHRDARTFCAYDATDVVMLKGGARAARYAMPRLRALMHRCREVIYAISCCYAQREQR